LDFAALRTELAVPGDFSSAAIADANAAAASPDLPASAYRDRTDIPFVTVDPAGSMDLDQAVHITRRADGYLVDYAIADVAAFVRPGSALEAETLERGETIYFPDTRIPLHPAVLSEAAASLLPDEVRRAVLWSMALDASGEVTSTEVRRALVRSVAKLDYTGLQRQIDSGSPPEAVALLPEVGTLRQQLARARHSINIDLPEQDVVESPAGYTITLRAPLPVEQWNAEISLLTGMCAAKIMLDAGHGILRTVPPPDERAVDALKAAARALGIDYPDDALPGDVLASVNPNDPRHVAFVEHAGALLRGSAYTVFDGTAPQQPLHAGIGAAYAHVTAPLRRLVDRFATEICLAAQANSQTPRWVRDRLAQLPGLMAAADRRAHEADRAVIDMTEAWLLQERIGQRFRATVIDANTHSATIVLDEPAVRARCAGENLTVGATIPVTLVGADVAKRTVSFTA